MLGEGAALGSRVIIPRRSSVIEGDRSGSHPRWSVDRVGYPIQDRMLPRPGRDSPSVGAAPPMVKRRLTESGPNPNSDGPNPGAIESAITSTQWASTGRQATAGEGHDEPGPNPRANASPAPALHFTSPAMYRKCIEPKIKTDIDQNW